MGGTHHLLQQRPETSGVYIPAPPRGDVLAQPIVLPNLAGESTSTIRSLVRTLHFETAPDWSGSTFSVWGGDPHDVIGAVAISLFMLLRRYGGGTAGVTPWGTTPATELGVGPLQVKKDLKRLKRAVRDRRNLGGNDLPAALRAIARKQSGAGPSFTWVPTDGIENVTQATHDAVAALPPNSVHLVLIDPLHGCTEAMEDDWRSVAFGSVTRIDDLSVKNVATTIGQLVAGTVGLQLGAATPVPTDI